MGARTRACACARVALPSHGTRRHIVICDLSGFTTFFDMISNGKIFGKKIMKHKMRILIFSTASV
jgi:hypothetical protein